MSRTSPASEKTSAATNQTRRVCAPAAGSSKVAAAISATRVAGLQTYSSVRLEPARGRAFADQSPIAQTAATAYATATAAFTARAARGSNFRDRRGDSARDRA